jgi:hypothetical protein
MYYRIKELCIKLVIKTSLYYDAQSEKHKKIPSKGNSKNILVKARPYSQATRWSGCCFSTGIFTVFQYDPLVWVSGTQLCYLFTYVNTDSNERSVVYIITI